MPLAWRWNWKLILVPAVISRPEPSLNMSAPLADRILIEEDALLAHLELQRFRRAAPLWSAGIRLHQRRSDVVDDSDSPWWE